MRTQTQRRIGYSACIGGALIMASYFGARAWSTHTSNEAIEALRGTRALLPVATAAAQDPLAAHQRLASTAPDTSAWSAKRVAEYQQAVASPAIPEAVLQIPRLKIEVAVFDGTSDAILNRGAGRIEGTSPIDSHTGNIGIAAHRDGFFRPLKGIAVGDLIQIETVHEIRSYQVTSLKIVTPGDVSVLNHTPHATLTLVTCYPFYHVGTAPQRFVVQARVIGRSSFAVE